MIKRGFFILYILGICVSPIQAEIQISDFCGSYSIIINGSKGVLHLTSCQHGKDYNLRGTYSDINKIEMYQVEGYTGHLNPNIPYHKVIFFINFKKHRQMFEGYLMIKTKDAIAGHTIVDKIPVGFYATKVREYQHTKKEIRRKSVFERPIRDKISELRYILKDIRTAILMYNGQHHPKAKLGFIWDEKTQRQIAYTCGKDVVNQLLQRTNRNGLTKEKGAAEEGLNYGPYFHGEFPINPITGGNKVHLVNSPLPIEKFVSPKGYDWIYNLHTSEFRAGGEIILPLDIPERREDNSLFNF